MGGSGLLLFDFISKLLYIHVLDVMSIFADGRGGVGGVALGCWGWFVCGGRHCLGVLLGCGCVFRFSLWGWVVLFGIFRKSIFFTPLIIIPVARVAPAAREVLWRAQDVGQSQLTVGEVLQKIGER